MASIDIERLLEPISTEGPSGPNLEYDSAFLALERLSLGKPEQRMGDSIRAAEPPDFEAVAREAAALLERSKDLRVAVQFSRAQTHLHGFRGLRAGLELVHGLLDRFFPSVHPQLDPDEDNDPTMRITAVAGLCASELLTVLRTTPLIVSRSFGPVTLRDFAVAAGTAAPIGDAPKLDMAGIEAAFTDCELPAHEAMAAALKAAVAAVSGIEGVFERETAGQGPDLAALMDLLRQASHAVVPRLERRLGTATEDSAGASGGPAAAGTAGPGKAFSGDIRSRADVVRALDKICEYYAEFEPSSPIPLLLERGKRLVSKSFLDIIRDMAPDGVPQVETIAGKADA
ncbi:MAG TPA: type VI secretion system protein TssA [Polyangiaceae bacterium]|nr:type VI secretion system protein TssA [Polyangiaceae bacterium]